MTKFDKFGDVVERTLAKPISFVAFVLWCALVPLISIDAANYGISFITALLLFITIGLTRKDRRAIHIKLDDLETCIDVANSENAEIEKKLDEV